MLDLGIFAAPLVSFLVGGFVGKEFYRYLDKPKVVIRIQHQVLFTQPDGFFVSVRIANAGRTAAQNCKGTITLFGITDEQIIDPQEGAVNENLHEYREENYKFENPRPQFITKGADYKPVDEPLCWADLGNPHLVDINPGTTHRLDICKYFQSADNNYFIFPSDRGWRKLRVRIKAEVIKGRILICPANDFPTAVYFELSVEDDGKPNLKMTKPGAFERVKNVLFRSNAFSSQI
ncbi:hypothetical protein ABVF61_31550 [Roseibium sp. HPY-6]|uniref:hypothetical protein n=1 Tax=Roseibium sp. HPY-6 TaxID=3229852 RepID=UPI00338EC0A7